MLKTCPCYNRMEENETIVDYSRRKLTKVPQEVLVRGRELEELYLDSNSIEILPKGLFNLPKLRVLSASDNNLLKLSTFVGNLDRLEKLDVSKNCIAGFPDTIVRCSQLAQVDASVNPIVKLSDEFISLSNLTHLILNETFLECLPEHFGRLSRLKVLELRQNHLHNLPKSMYNLKELERLDIGENKFLHLPVAVGYLPNLCELMADGNMIEEIPPVIGLLRNLVLLDLSKNKLESLPPEIEAMKGLTDLYLSFNELLELPDNIGSLSNLQTLKLDENDLIFLPSSMGRLHCLEELDVTTNNLEGLPRTIGMLTKLRVLTLDNNCIKSLPEELGNCSSLSLLSLHSNDLIAVPETLGSLQNLQMINLSGNMLTSLPFAFLGLKNLKALWLSENQSKPVVPLQKTYSKKERKYFVTCHLLPQSSDEKDQMQNSDGEESDETGNSCSAVDEDKGDIEDDREEDVIRTRGSIAQSFVPRKGQKSGALERKLKPWYEQEFIESADDSDDFPDHEEVGDKDVSEEGSYNLSQGRSALQESLQSRYSFKEEQPNSLSQSPSKISFRDDQPSYTTVSESPGTYQDIHSFSKDSYSSSSLLSAQVFPRESTKTGAVGLMRGLVNHIDRSSLADTAAETSNSYVDGNTSASSSPPPVLNSIDRENNFTDPKFAFPISDDDNMRLRFNNKRHRNGIPLCQYEAFKPTRFNQFKENDDVSWKDLPDISSPRKKSAISKDNPVIGKRLARDESPQRRGENIANQKYEEKIRLLQQQRLKERSRRRNNSARAEYCGEQGDAQFSKISDTPPPYTNEHRDISTPSLPPHQPPPYYLISDEGDSVAVKLSDFALVSSGEGSRAAADRRKNNHARRHETTVTGSGRTQHSQTSSPVGFNRFNGFDQQHNTASHYFNHTRDQSSFGKSNVLQTSVLHNGVRESEVSGSGASSSTSTPQVGVQRRGKGGGNGKYHKSSSVNNHVMTNVEQRDDFNHSNRPDYKTSVDNNVASFAETHHENQRKREDHSGKYLNYPKSQIQEPKIRTGTPEISFEHERVTFGRDYSLNTSLSGNQRPVKNLLPPNNSVHHVTVTSRNISRPVSPRLVMAVDGKNVSNDLTFKEFLPGCAVEDVTSFLVSNINDFAPQKISRDNSDHTAQEPVSLKMTGSAVPLKATGIESGGKDKDGTQLIQEQVSMDCDVEEVTRNISKHLVEFCKVQDVESDKDVDERSKIKVRVTDLDMPDAACPLSRNGQHKNEFEGNGKQGKDPDFKVISVPAGSKQEVRVRVYRSPNLGFSIGGGMENGTDVAEGIYVVAVKPDGPSAHLLKPGDRILEVNKLSLRSALHEHAVLFLTHNQELDLLIERVRTE